MRLTPLSPAHYRRFPWKNGGGVTIDIAEAREPGSAPGAWEGLIWRLGRTTIAAPGPFSDLSGFDRQQVVVAGSGLWLVGPARAIDLSAPFRPVAYPGEERLVSRLDEGPVEVVNLIAARGRVKAELTVAQAGERLTLNSPLLILYAPAGAVRLGRDAAVRTLAHDHALRIEEAQGALLVEEGTLLAATIAR
jgi:hypothetical protein